MDTFLICLVVVCSTAALGYFLSKKNQAQGPTAGVEVQGAGRRRLGRFGLAKDVVGT